jgi:uncharacterized protein YggE
MGKIKVEGKIEKFFRTDIITMTIIFKKSDTSKAKAINDLLIECEDFLSKIKSAGFDMNNISVASEKSRYRMNNEFEYYDIEKKIELKIKADFKLSNNFIKFLQSENYEAEYILSFSFSDKARLQKQLLLEAIEDSKRKAELIASSMNMKIIKIEEICKPDFRSTNLAKSVCVENFGFKLEGLLSGNDVVDTSNLDMLNTPEEKLYESVDVVWLTE